ncbi:MAG: phenylacetate-CoA oxygenase subunit PaaJ [Chitinophagaceae bacterium]|nr:phenylacetate-CoA oxygenase subunit PaaJ [Chitinophagaceae bacterium]
MNEENKILSILQSVPDPEIPVLSVIDLGIVRSINIVNTGKKVEITVTPTYSGCPAMDVITINIRMALLKSGYKEIVISKALAPAWTTDWMTETGKQKLKAYGIAPPAAHRQSDPSAMFAEQPAVQCPQCNSFNTTIISEFGSTACKALYRCNDCGEPFDHFKCH